MSLVVDASVLIAALVDSGARGTWAEVVLSDEGPIHVPELAFVEVANVLRRLERSRQISTAEATAAYEDFLDLPVEAFPFEPFAQRVWELRHGMTSYDAWYVALAEGLEVPLATLDTKLTRTRNVSCKFLSPGRTR